VLEAFSDLLQKYPFTDPTVRIAGASIVVDYHNLDPVSTEAWFEDARSALEELGRHTGHAVTLNRDTRFCDLYDLVAGRVNGLARWRLVDMDLKQKSVTLEAEALELFDQNDLREYLDRQVGWSLSFVEKSFGYNECSVLAFGGHPGLLDELTFAEATKVQETILSVLPGGLGECSVELDGNRIVVEYSTTALPSTYLFDISSDFGQYSIPIELKSRERSLVAPSKDVVEDIIRRSLVEGDYLHTLDETDEGWHVVVYQTSDQSREGFEQFRSDLEACAGKRVTCTFPRLTPEFSSLLKRIPRDAAELLSSSCEPDGVTYNAELFRNEYAKRFEDVSKFVPLGSPDQGVPRMDLRSYTTRAIDRRGTGVVEDALSWRILRNGNLELAVHIVDPTWMFESGSDVDSRAFSRGMSDQGRGYRIPLLAEDEVVYQSSLKVGHDRPAITLFVELTPEGEGISARFERSAIRLDARNTFEEVDECLKGKVAGITAGRYRVLQKYLRPFIEGQRRHGVNFGPAGESAGRQIVAASSFLFDSYASRYFRTQGLPFVELVQPPPDERVQREVVQNAERHGFHSEQSGQNEAVQALSFLSRKLSPLAYKRVMATTSEKPRFQVGIGERHFSLNTPVTSATKPLKSYASLSTIRSLERSLRGATPYSVMQVKRVVDQLNHARRDLPARKKVFGDISRFSDILEKEGAQVFATIVEESAGTVELRANRYNLPIVAERGGGEFRKGDTALCVIHGFDFVQGKFLGHLL
jgi:hypothetical protein